MYSDSVHLCSNQLSTLTCFYLLCLTRKILLHMKKADKEILLLITNLPHDWLQHSAALTHCLYFHIKPPAFITDKIMSSSR